MSFHEQQPVLVLIDGEWERGVVVYGERVVNEFDTYAVDLDDPGDREMPYRTNTLRMCDKVPDVPVPPSQNGDDVQ